MPLSRVLSPGCSSVTKFHLSDEVFKKLVPGTMVPAKPNMNDFITFLLTPVQQDLGDFDSLALMNAHLTTFEGQRGGVVSASDSRSEVWGFDSRPCHVAIALGKQFTLTFPSPSTCKMAIQLQASNVLVCWGISGAALWRHSYAE
ncbi:hypothetical protein ElyMa_003759000 [Elysia marginata]|uniref:Uncharacterized protein n=1 Tax=Elysia marginata TaxID=1093978 RepID=A0AAV4FA12_9GAST|nr:hypothetical protein ElyMa_003759000 [Elysia marginata]